MRIAALLAIAGVVLVGYGIFYVTIGGPPQDPPPLLTRNQIDFYLGLVLLVLAVVQGVRTWLARHPRRHR